MLYIWHENGQIRAAPFEDTAKQYTDNYIAMDISIEDLSKLKVENGQIVFKSEQELVEERKPQALQELKSLFIPTIQSTDYIILKIQELQFNNQPIDKELQEKLNQRINLRQSYELAKETIKNATTLQEIEQTLNILKEMVNATQNI